VAGQCDVVKSSGHPGQLDGLQCIIQVSGQECPIKSGLPEGIQFPENAQTVPDMTNSNLGTRPRSTVSTVANSVHPRSPIAEP
jgi:hypothetical protein